MLSQQTKESHKTSFIVKLNCQYSLDTSIAARLVQPCF